MNKFLKGLLLAATLTVSALANATTVTVGNAATGGSISSFGLGSFNTATYGQVFKAPVTGVLTSFTLSLNGGVGSLYGGIDGWNGTESHGFGFGSSGNLYTSASVTSSGAQAYTFSPNINVVAGQLYVAYLSVFGDANASGATSMPLGNNSDPSILYFVWNNATDPKNNPSWNYFFNTGDALFSAKFTANNVNAVPVPAAAWLFGSALLGLFGMRKRETA